MVSRAVVYGKKLLSLSLIFNSLLSIAYAVGLLSGYYNSGWTLYVPYLVDGALFWLLILTSILNIFPSAIVGQVKTGRLWFHHYVYGFLVLALALAYLTLDSPVSLLNLFTTNTTSIVVNVGRFFVLGGTTLILDDLPDVSRVSKRLLCFLKSKAYRVRRIMHVMQYIMSFVTAYLLMAVILYIARNPESATIANLIFSATLLVTSLVSMGIAKSKTWIQMPVMGD